MKKNKWLMAVVMGITAMSLVACAGVATNDAPIEEKTEAAPDSTDAAITEENASDSSDTVAPDSTEKTSVETSKTETGSEDDEKKILSQIEGIWMTPNVPGTLVEFKGSEKITYAPIIDDEGMNSKNEFKKAGTSNILSVEKASDEVGEYYLISVDDKNTYRLYTDRTDDLECHIEPEGYSASGSLIRQTGTTISDYNIVE